ncbi:MAG: uroporphyrinogen decarboxylase family protein [Christensenellales bacterium]|jgi:uroporphyrinogen decarboxylase
MHSRKIYLDTLEMRNDHSRAPRDLWTLPWAEVRYPDAIAEIRKTFPGDGVGTSGFPKERGIGRGNAYEPGTSTDDWGCEFVSIQEGIIGEVKRPQIASDDWAEADCVHIPREWLTVDREKIDDFCRAHPDKLRFGGCCPRPFEQLQFLRGTVNLYMDLMDMPENMVRFLAKMHAFYCELLETWAKTEVDVLNFMDDWGSQQSLLIPPALWRQVFKPMYKDYIDIAHAHGKKIFMHSDGNTLEIIPDLIELGLDALNTQIFCIGIEKLAPFKGKITFWGEIDRQHLLPHGTASDIENAVTEVYETLWDKGGCVAQCEFGPGGRPENVRKVFETWDRLTARKSM